MIESVTPARRGSDATTVVITCFNQARYLCDAIRSVHEQTVQPSELIVVDDGSTDETLAVAARFAGVRVVQQPNRGLAAARNAGLRECSSRFVIFLDADDRLLTRAVEAGSRVLDCRPDAAFAYGRFRYVAACGIRRPSGLRGGDNRHAYLPLLKNNFISMHAAVIYRRGAVAAAGGFDERLRACEDYDLYLRLAREHPVVPHDEIVAEYRQHDRNMSHDSLRMLAASLQVLEKQRPFLDGLDRREAFRDGRRAWVRRYGPGVVHDISELVGRRRWREAMAATAAFGRLARTDAIRITAHKLATRRARLRQAASRIRWGSLRRPLPVSSCWGFDRGQPVDRYYIERFLREFSEDVRGHVLEIGSDTYTRAFGNGGVTHTDILEVDNSNPRATIVGDLACADHIPSNSFDCIILTQTLHLIYDIPAALRTIHRILKPNGVVLATVPGISPFKGDRWEQSWYWSLSEFAARRLFESAFGREVVTYTAGNVQVATAFLYGLAAQELTPAELDHVDPRYPVTIGIRATK